MHSFKQGFILQSCQEADHKRRRELKERELSAKRKREDQEKKREDQERKREETKQHQEKNNEEKTQRRGVRLKASTTERVNSDLISRELNLISVPT